MAKIIIIGNGIAGITCAREVRKKSTDEILVISAESEHFYSRTALMYIFMGHLTYAHTKPYEDFFWKKNKIDLLTGYVSAVDTDAKKIIADNKEIPYDRLVIASGSLTKKFDWPGQDLKGVTGLYNLQDLQLVEAGSKDCRSAVIVGGGLIGVELAEMLHSRKIAVTMLVKDKHYWGGVLPETDALFIGRHIAKHGISILYETGLAEIKGMNGSVCAVITSKGQEIPCGFVGIATGVAPNIGFLTNCPIKIDKGILVNNYFETSVPDVYALGDCAQFTDPPPLRKSIEQVWYTGKMHGETLAQTLTGNRTVYQPGPWFNSAKFFDIEYQTYGQVAVAAGDGQAFFHWQHPKGQVAFTALYQSSSKKLEGINCYGMRLRHPVLDKWLKEKRTVEYVLTRLSEAIFNTEFTRNDIKSIIAHYNRTNNTNLNGVQKNRLLRFFSFT